jgi:hypothetical protein
MRLEDKRIVALLFTQGSVLINRFGTDWNTFLVGITPALLQMRPSLFTNRLWVLIFPLNWGIDSMVLIGCAGLSVIRHNSRLPFALLLRKLFLETLALLVSSLRPKMRAICLPGIGVDSRQNSAWLFGYLWVNQLSIFFERQLCIVIDMQLYLEFGVSNFPDLFLVVKLCDIFMPEHLHNSQSFARIKLQHFRDEVQEERTCLAPKKLATI